MRKISIDPVTRLEGHLKVEVEIDNGKVVNAHAVGTMYRGFESILAGRDPRDAVFITQRICGVCPVSHATASAMALDEALGADVPKNGRLLRNLILGGNYLQSHIIHFYNLSMPDYVQFPEIAPFTPHYKGDFRFNKDTNDRLVANYFKALEIRRKCHEMIANFSGKMPHQSAIIAGGVSCVPTQARIDAYRKLLAEITAFVENDYQQDVQLIAKAYSDYFQSGVGPKNLLVYGAFPMDDHGREMLFPAGVMMNGKLQPLNRDKIIEDVSHAWYDAATGGNPAEAKTKDQWGKAGAYSWVKAPRYDNTVCEVGPLARMIVSGRYQGGISAMDRIVARMMESMVVARTLPQWLDELEPGVAGDSIVEIPYAASGAGLCEAPRGALGHWITINNHKIERYQAVVPTTWNASSRDQNGKKGALEEALIGLPVPDADNPLPIVRAVHSFDPCLACAVHIIEPGKKLQPIE